ncbi:MULTISPECIES: biopolymer transporter ExbD [Caulobacter]|jgi:biopolymer transport protein ExbD|uniref:Biopolymer transport protein n=1 Tax=Caulobacter vibrioides OR37 TaxID=1292034 RepID=R0E5E0_CAUVI|nr:MULTISPECIES: biopolymer transporter ExbD [Caulobacter]ENZ77354.1 biopolymer transport protein [Caulobacter vibrioides OR37]MBQ1559609.1 biopolymer transporter ExbD [Caulobacter sp.]
MAQRLAGRFEARPMVAINIAPLVPILLSVFVVMLLVSPTGRAGPLIDQPPMDCFGQCKPNDTVFISLRGDGVALLMERKVADAELPALLLASGSVDRGVYVRADAEVAYGRVFKLMSGLQAAGFKPQFINEDLH